MKLYAVTHRAVAFLPEGRTPIGVGPDRAIAGVETYDDTGDNIHEKNPNYCELTALYWIWKNEDEDVIGLEHYRRFFCKKHTVFRCRQLSQADIAKILKKHDCITTRYFRFLPSVYGYYAAKHDARDLDSCRAAIEKLCPEYLADFDAVMKQKKAVMFNMLVMPKALISDYCAWLFPILEEVEKSVDLEAKDDYQKRVYGFLSERLFNVWLHRKSLNVYRAPVFYPDELPIRSFLTGLAKRILRRP